MLVWVFDAEVTHLIQLYIVGVFVSFTLSQTGMVRHWTRLLATETDSRHRRRMQRSRVVNGVGLAMTGTVLIIVLITKFLAGAWIAILAMVIVFVTMRAVNHHYRRVAAELDAGKWDGLLPSRTYSIVLVAKLHHPTRRALAYASATHPDTLEAITVDVDEEDTRALVREWEASDITIPLKVLESPYREITRPVLTTSGGCAATRRATWSPSSSPNTSWGTGGRICSTIRARCDSRVVCCSSPG